jgi:hypothetical protein
VKAFILSAAAAIMIATAAPAGACYAPREPWCISFNKPDQTCRSEVQRYLNDEEQYRRCVTEEARTRKEESARRAQTIANKWNCLAEGRSSCW